VQELTPDDEEEEEQVDPNVGPQWDKQIDLEGAARAAHAREEGGAEGMDVDGEDAGAQQQGADAAASELGETQAAALMQPTQDEYVEGGEHERLGRHSAVWWISIYI
jgi:hypothetical protein